VSRSLRLTLFIALTSTTIAIAQTASSTRLIPYSAAALNVDGSPVTGEVTLTFALYEEQVGGASLWHETQRVHTDQRGRYLVYLGNVTPIPQVVFSEERARWLAVIIDGREQTRAMLAAAPYALHAADAETLGGHPAASFVRSGADGRLETGAGNVVQAAVDGSGVTGQLTKWASPDFLSSSVISESATNRVGVGLPDPTGGGVVDSVFTIRNFDNNTGFAVLNESQQRRFALNTRANGSWILYDGTGGTWNAGFRQVGGRVGVGTEPVTGVDVLMTNTNAGRFVLSGGGGLAALVGRTDGSGPAVSAHTQHASAGTAIKALSTNSGASHTLLVGAFQSPGGEVNVFRVNAAGNVFAASYTVGGADFAEEVDTLQPVQTYEPGDVMIIGSTKDRAVTRSNQPYATTVIGVYSTQPGIVASPHTMDDPDRMGKLPLAMIGIVPCKVSDENGAIQRGDLLVTSGTPGHAMKGTERDRMTGAIVGKALEPLASGTGKILIAVTLQ
jgi:hypothetical protein